MSNTWWMWADVPGQTFSLHDLVISLFISQSLPPYAASTLMALDICFAPTPQVLLHTVQPVHSSNLQSTYVAEDDTNDKINYACKGE